MNKEAVIEYFDRMAPGWDSHMKRNERAITRILDNAHVKEGVKVLDVACGTGVLIPDYLNRNVIKKFLIYLSMSFKLSILLFHYL